MSDGSVLAERGQGSILRVEPERIPWVREYVRERAREAVCQALCSYGKSYEKGRPIKGQSELSSSSNERC